MTINDISNGPEGAQNPCKQSETSIQIFDGNFEHESSHVAAIAEAYGLVSLIGPVTLCHNEIDYTFDFYQPDEQLPFKVVCYQDTAEFEKYAVYLGRKVLIVDVEGCDFRLLDCQCDGEPRLCIPEKIGRPVANAADACLYFDERLWKADEAYPRAVGFDQDAFQIDRRVRGAWSVWRPLSIDEFEEAGVV